MPYTDDKQRLGPVDLETLLAETDRMIGERAVWEPTWRLLGEFFLPHKKNVTIQTTPGQKQTERLFDSTAPHATTIFAANLHGSMTSPAQKWFGLDFRQHEVNRMKPARDWLEDTADRGYRTYGQCNFTTQLLEAYLELIVFGTCNLAQLQKEGSLPGRFAGLEFRAIPIGDYVFEENPEGRADRCTRRFQIPVRQAYRRWGDKIGPALLTLYRQKPESQVELWHSVYPRSDKWPMPLATGMQKPWGSCYWSREHKHKIAEGGFDEFPYAIARWMTSPGETWGRSPCWIALPDARTLNREIEIYLGASAKAVDPTLLMLNDSVMGQLSLEPASVNVVTERDAVWALESKAHFDAAKMLHDRLESKIREILYIDRIQLQGDREMTATEVMQRVEIMQKLLGPAGGRIQDELLAPTIERTVAILARSGALLPVPEQLRQVNATIDIRYEGPLARAQRSGDLVAIQRKNAWVAAVLPLKPDVTDLWDYDEEGRLVSELAGVPSDLVNDADQVAALREDRAKQHAAQATLQAGTELAKAGGAVAPLVKQLQGAPVPASQAAA